jgi:hypothetical protein
VTDPAMRVMAQVHAGAAPPGMSLGMGNPRRPGVRRDP